MKRIACINTKSGNISDCHFLMRCLKEHLGPQNVFDLSLVTPLQVLEECSPDQILCCGGDGTVAWILSSLDEFVFVGKRPVIGVIPLGTGNDLARALGWGAGFHSGTDIGQLLADLDDAIERNLDRWRVTVVGLQGHDGRPERAGFFTMNNYLSVGCDAAVCKAFHELRESLPSLCSSRLGNKMIYTIGGTKAFFEEHVPLDQALKLTVDGRRVDLPPDVFGLMILNINSYAGGADLYNSNEDKDNGSSGFRPQCFYDGKIEVVGVSGTFNLGAAAVGLSEGIRIAQGSELAIEFNDNRAHTGLWYQLDGEPASDPLIAPSVIRIRSLFEEQPTRVLCKE